MLKAVELAETISPTFKVTVPVKVLALERINVPTPFLVKPPDPEMEPPTVVLLPPSTVSRLAPQTMFEFKVKFPDDARKVCAAPNTTGIFNVSVLDELFKMPLLPLVSVLPLVALRVKLPAVPSNVTPVTL